MDPCEKEPTDALESMLLHAREDLTVSAQVQNIHTDCEPVKNCEVRTIFNC